MVPQLELHIAVFPCRWKLTGPLPGHPGLTALKIQVVLRSQVLLPKTSPLPRPRAGPRVCSFTPAIKIQCQLSASCQVRFSSKGGLK